MLNQLTATVGFACTLHSFTFHFDPGKPYRRDLLSMFELSSGEGRARCMEGNARGKENKTGNLTVFFEAGEKLVPNHWARSRVCGTLVTMFMFGSAVARLPLRNRDRIVRMLLLLLVAVASRICAFNRQFYLLRVLLVRTHIRTERFIPVLNKTT